MVQLSKKHRKSLAIDLRTKGFSYSEIVKEISVPKATLSYWLKKLKLTEPQLEKLKNRRLKTALANSQKRTSKITEEIEKIKNFSAKDIKKISKRELWLMGIALYWRERFLFGNESDLKKGVRFTSSDPFILRLFLRWLKEIGKLENKEIDFDIFAKKDSENPTAQIIQHWARVTGFTEHNFRHIYFQKKRRRRSKKKISSKNEFGFLRVRVKASSMLARQIAGWIKGIKEYYW
jgi:transposase